MLFVTQHRLTFSHAPHENDELYRGSAWRGAFGHALKALDEKAYDYLFETPIAQYGADLRNLHGSHAPHPMVISPTGTEPGGDGQQLSHVDLILIGRGILFEKQALQALAAAGAGGIYGDRYQLRQVSHFHPQAGWLNGDNAASFSVLDAPPPPEASTLQLLHPLRLKQHQSADTLSAFNASELARSVIRRYCQLETCHDSSWAAPEYGELFAECQRLEIHDTELNWFDWKRYSSRQQHKVPMGGIVGQLVLSGEGLPAIWPCLWLGQWLHLGKGAVMGMGKYVCSGNLP